MEGNNKKIDIPTPVLQLYNHSGMPTSKRCNDPQLKDHNESDNAIGQNLDDQHDDNANEDTCNGCDSTQNLEQLAIVDEADDDIITETQKQTQNAVHF